MSFTRYQKMFLLLFICLLLIAALPAQAQSDEPPVTKVILFYSPTCPHCINVMENILPPLQDTYGDQLEIQFLNLTEPFGSQVYTALHERFPELPNGVPQMYVSDQLLLGADQIQDGLPVIIEDCLANGGCDWTFTYGAQPEAAAETAAPIGANLFQLAAWLGETIAELLN